MIYRSSKENPQSYIEIRELMQKQIQLGASLPIRDEELLNEYLDRHPLMYFFLYSIEAMRYDYGKPKDYYKKGLENWIHKPRILDEDD